MRNRRPAAGARFRQVSEEIGQPRRVPGIVGQPVAREVNGDRLDLELARDLDWQGRPGIKVGAGLVEQERDIRSIAPAKPADDLSPGKAPLDCLRAERGPVAYVPHSLCL